MKRSYANHFSWLPLGLVGVALCLFLKVFALPALAAQTPAAHLAAFFACLVVLPIVLQRVSLAVGRRWNAWYGNWFSALLWVAFWAVMTVLFLFWLAPVSGGRPLLWTVILFTTVRGLALLLGVIVVSAVLDRQLGKRA